MDRINHVFFLIISYCFFNARLLRADHLEVKINRQIQNQGFHRYLKTDIQIKDLKYKYYSWLLVEQFNADVYVDLHEIKQKQYTSNYSFIFSNRVNTETSEYKAVPFKLFIFVQSDQLINCDFVDVNARSDYVCRLMLSLPIHARYRAPQTNSYFFNFTLNRPLIFVRNLNDFKSNDSSLVSEEITFSAENTSKLMFPCQKGNLDYLNQIRQPEALLNLNVCEWTQLKTGALNETDLLAVEVPTGNKDYEVIVLIVTLVVVMFVALSVARWVSKKVQSITCVCNGEADNDSLHSNEYKQETNQCNEYDDMLNKNNEPKNRK